jgi:hypothetical protein
MLITCYLRDAIVYIPTVARRKSSPIYSNIEPVSVVPIGNVENVRRALLETIARKNPVIPDRDPKSLRERPLLPKYAGVKSLPAFFRKASAWGITEDDGVYKILIYRKHPKGYWHQDPEKEIRFPAGTKVDDVVNRMIAILDDAARTAPE